MLNIKNIRSVYNESKYSKSEVSAGTGLSRPTINGLLDGADVKISTLVAWANFFSKPISFFLEENECVCVSDITSSAVNVNGTIHGGQNVTACSGESAVLQEKVKLLEQLLEEKERLIKVLMESRK